MSWYQRVFSWWTFKVSIISLWGAPFLLSFVLLTLSNHYSGESRRKRVRDNLLVSCFWLIAAAYLAIDKWRNWRDWRSWRKYEQP